MKNEQVANIWIFQIKFLEKPTVEFHQQLI